MAGTRGIEVISESIPEGTAAEKGSRVRYSARVFLRRGDEVTPDYRSIAIYGDRVPTRVVEGTRLIEHTTILGKRRAIAGVERALTGLTPGSFREIVVPPHLGYGEKGLADRIPPNALLRIKIWVHEVETGEQLRRRKEI